MSNGGRTALLCLALAVTNCNPAPADKRPAVDATAADAIVGTDMGPPDVTAPDQLRPDGPPLDQAPDQSPPDSAQPDIAQPDLMQPDLLKPDLMQPDTMPSTCGNGLVEGGEQCDGKALSHRDCSSHGFPSGTLKCNKNCTVDTSACSCTRTGVWAITSDYGTKNGQACINTSWQYNGSSSRGQAVVPGPAGSVILSGRVYEGISLGGITQCMSPKYGGFYIAAVSSAGKTQWINYPNLDPYIMSDDVSHLVRSGNKVWAASVGFGYLAAVSMENTSGTSGWHTRLHQDVGKVDLRGLAVDAQGNTYLLGRLFGYMVMKGGASYASSGPSSSAPKCSGFSSCDWDLFLIKVSSAGVIKKVVTWGSVKDDDAGGLTLDASGNIRVIGIAPTADKVKMGTNAFSPGTNGALYELVLDSTGAWNGWKKLGDPGLMVRSVAADGVGGRYLAGDFKGAASLGGKVVSSAGLDDIFVARLDSQGKVAWIKTLGGGLDEHQTTGGIAVDGKGRVVVTGKFNGSLTLNKTKLTSAGGWDALVVRLSPLGEVEWAARAGGAGDEDGAAPAAASDGTVHVTCTRKNSKTGTAGKESFTGAGGGGALLWRVGKHPGC